MESEDKRMAWFPAPYLEKMEEDGDEDDIDGAPERGSRRHLIFVFLYASAFGVTRHFLWFSGTLYVTVKSYKAAKGDEVTAAVGAVVEVLQKSDNGWWLIR